MTIYAGKGSILQVTISAVLTTISGVRNFTFNPGETETMEVDALADDYVKLQVTGRTGSGNVSGTMFLDPANAQVFKLHGLMNTPADEAWSITWGSSAVSQAFNGILTKMETKVERADPITDDFEIAISSRPTLPTS